MTAQSTALPALSWRVGARRVRQVGRWRSTMGSIRTFVLEVMEMGDRPELQDPPEPSQPRKLLTAKEILSAPDEAPPADLRPDRPRRVLDLDALIAEREAEQGERRGISVARLLAASEGQAEEVEDLSAIVRDWQRSLAPDLTGILASMTAAQRFMESFTPAALLAATFARQAEQQQAMLEGVVKAASSYSPMLDMAQALAAQVSSAMTGLGGMLQRLVSPLWESPFWDWLRERSERREIADFLAAMSIDPDDPVLADKSHEQLLADARLMTEVLERYKATHYIPPQSTQPMQPGPAPDPGGFWESMARNEHAGRQTRQETINTYLTRNDARVFVAPAGMKAYVRKALFDARQRLGISTSRENS